MLNSALRATLPLVNYQPTRGLATLKDIRNRLKSVKNIQKITQSMKMVSAAKYARADRELQKARSFSAAFPLKFREEAETKSDAAQPVKPGTTPTLVIAITSDRGLCGAVHSSVARKIKAMFAASDNPENIKIVCVGDKSRTLLARAFPKNVLLTYNNFGKKPPSFADAQEVARDIIESGYNFDKGAVVYNKFRTVVSYLTSDEPVFSLDQMSNSPKIYDYDSVDADVLRNYYEYSLASLIYYVMKENACSEQSSRMSAMDNASKNAGEMIGKYQLQFNRTRQAVITRELIEIISGAAAL
uniref:ATP synthase subunit gamma n=1 Tax=Aceria tosichella TaxID=561515 RepID=A0A6G1S855_9ACAR